MTPGLTISGSTRIAAVIGWPVTHSQSPAMLNAAFAHAEVDAVLVPIGAAPEQLPAVLAGLRAMRVIGASVTVPHKVAVAALCDELSPAARAIGAVNCIELSGGRLIGHNTDAPGFTDAAIAAGCSPRGARCVLLGAGGAARAVAHGLEAAGATVTVIARGTPTWCAAEPWSTDAMAAAFARADLLVDTTPIALDAATEPAYTDALPLAALPAAATVASLVYHRTPRLLTRAAAAGHRTLDGAGMLVHQGARAFTLWTGLPAPLDVMRQALAHGAEPR